MIERAGTGERVYLAIKTLLAEGDHRPGERLDIRQLERSVGASATPVRGALNRLAGERLLVSHQGEGFSLPRLTEPGLGDLYAWNAAILLQAVRSTAPGHKPDAALHDLESGRGLVAATDRLFAVIAAMSDNVEIEWALAGASDRLHRARRAELDQVSDGWLELREMATLVEAEDLAPLRQAIVAYHRRRMRLVPALVRVLLGLGDRERR